MCMCACMYWLFLSTCHPSTPSISHTLSQSPDSSIISGACARCVCVYVCVSMRVCVYVCVCVCVQARSLC